MKKHQLCILIFAFILPIFTACEKQILDKKPLDNYSDATIWADFNLANRYLLQSYNCLQADLNVSMLSNLTDESNATHAFGMENYLTGNISADNPSPIPGAWGMDWLSWDVRFSYIQEINIFISNVDKVLDSYNEPEKSTMKEKVDGMKGEAYFLRAFCYHQLVFNYGGVPIMKVPNKLGDDFLTITRATFEETVNFITSDCDAAFDLLGDEMEMGRATRGAALALKSRVLLFAASDLTADGTAENEFVGYTNPNRNALWTAAKNAAKAVMDLGMYELADFGAPDRTSVSKNYFGLFKSKDLSNKEIIWGKMFLKGVGPENNNNMYHGSNGFGDWGCTAPSQNLVDAYQMEDGSDFFDHFELDNEKLYKNISIKYQNENIYYNRDPRFYGTILYDSAKWLNRYADLIERDPLGIYDRRTRITSQNGVEISKIFGIDTKGGPVDSEDGTNTGYVMKKYLDDEVYSMFGTNENVWIELRYAEVLMNYAEACLELGETSEATTYINMVRNRAAMPDFTGDIRDALRYERRIEFAFESRRWYDIRRWKLLEEALTDANGVDIIEIKNLNDGTITTTWRQIHVEDRGPVQSKMSWLPIPRAEMKRAPQLVNNPGY
jgi:starch-binding outer membrane protein, SusD/RagB family